MGPVIVLLYLEAHFIQRMEKTGILHQLDHFQMRSILLMELTMFLPPEKDQNSFLMMKEFQPIFLMELHGKVHVLHIIHRIANSYIGILLLSSL